MAMATYSRGGSLSSKIKNIGISSVNKGNTRYSTRSRLYSINTHIINNNGKSSYGRNQGNTGHR